MDTRRWGNTLALLIALIAATTIAPTLVGQDEATEPAEADVQAATAEPSDEAGEGAEEANTPTSSDADPSTEESTGLANADSLLNMILDSGATGIAFMAVLGLFSLVAASVALERAVNMRRDRILPRTFIDELDRKTKQKDPRLDSLFELCSQYASPIATILQAGLSRRGHSLTEVEKGMEDAAAREMAELRAKIRPLRTIGGVAPLVGLLGTVVGMIIAFHTASQAGLGKAELLAKGIYMALLTTAGGLSVAIPSMLLGSFFTGKVERYFRQMDVHLLPVVPLLANAEATAIPVDPPARAAEPIATPQPNAEEKAPPPSQTPQSPASQSPASQSPASQPPASQSPASQPPPSQAPVSQPADPPKKKNPLMA